MEKSVSLRGGSDDITFSIWDIGGEHAWQDTREGWVRCWMGCDVELG